jgi:prepilin-type N-terminal cleavage/methylation domain-containing protein
MRRTRGFTLVELALALAVIGLLLGMLVVPLSAQVDQQRIGETQRLLNLNTEAILGFAVAHGRLPCPATPGTASGTLNAGTESCGLAQGVLPWAVLGVPETDAWGRRFTYRVTVALTDIPVGGLQASFTLDDTLGNTGDIAVKATSGGVDIAINVTAVVVSHGKNGFGAFQTTGVQLGGATGDELENANADMNFVSKLPEPAFDDQVAWVSPNVLKSRMVAANRLP